MLAIYSLCYSTVCACLPIHLIFYCLKFNIVLLLLVKLNKQETLLACIWMTDPGSNFALQIVANPLPAWLLLIAYRKFYAINVTLP